MPIPTGTRVTLTGRSVPEHPPLRPQPLRRPAVPAPQPLPPALAGPVPHAPDLAASQLVLDRLLDERIVYLGSEIDDAVADRVITQLLLLAAQDNRRDITLYLRAPGGSVTAGIAIYDAMAHIGPDVGTWAVGLVAGTGQFLLSAGAPGKRRALPHARVRMHQPSAGPGGGVHAQVRQEIAEITARHTGRSVATVVADTDRDHWFTAEEARSYGLVDQVTEG